MKSLIFKPNHFDSRWPAFSSFGRGLWDIMDDMERMNPYLPTNNGERDWYLPLTDIHETEREFLFSCDLPGVPESEIDIQVEGGKIKVTGERKQTLETKPHRSEKYFGRFLREFELPETADLDKVEAKFKDGVLELRVPKKEALTPRKIAIKS